MTRRRTCSRCDSSRRCLRATERCCDSTGGNATCALCPRFAKFKKSTAPLNFAQRRLFGYSGSIFASQHTHFTGFAGVLATARGRAECARSWAASLRHRQSIAFLQEFIARCCNSATEWSFDASCETFLGLSRERFQTRASVARCRSRRDSRKRIGSPHTIGQGRERVRVLQSRGLHVRRGWSAPLRRSRPPSKTDGRDFAILRVSVFESG